MITHQTEFASVAEAVAYYFELGYVTVQCCDTNGRYMTNGKDTIRIAKTGLLTVEVHHVIQ